MKSYRDALPQDAASVAARQHAEVEIDVKLGLVRVNADDPHSHGFRSTSKRRRRDVSFDKDSE